MFDATDEAEQEAAYSEKDLTGLKMNHGADEFIEGQQVILTLKDERILDGGELRDGGDELENITLKDKQAANKNTKLRNYKAGSAYSGLDDNEWNEDGTINKEGKGILAKYDGVVGLDKHVETKAGPSMVLGVDTKEAAVKKEQESKEDEIRGRIKENLQVNFSAIEEKYTQSEMAKFEKPKKLRKKKKDNKRKKHEGINWDAEEEKLIGQDHGSRGSINRGKDIAHRDAIQDAEGKLAYESALAKALVKTEESVLENNSKRRIIPEYDEEEEDDLGAALAKARQLNAQRISLTSADQLADVVKTEKTAEKDAKDALDSDDEDEDEDQLVIDPTKEFCKSIEVNEAEEEEEDEPEIRKEDKEEGGDPMDDEDMDDSDEEVEKDHEWAKDAMVSNGVGAALDFMRSRGSLKDTDESITGRFNDKTFESLYEGNHELDKDTGKKLNSFTLEYRDKFGRKMSQKEAFRQLSYGFHGKGPGKAKIEARQRKFAEEQRLRKQGQNGAIDLPITLQALKVQQKGTRQAHMVIGGGSGGMER